MSRYGKKPPNTTYDYKASRDFDTFLDAFVIEVIEANRCFTGTGGKADGDLLVSVLILLIAPLAA